MVHELVLQRHNGNGYSFPLQLGSRSKFMYCALDINFDNIIVTRNDCETKEKGKCRSKESYNPEESDTSVELNMRKKRSTY